MTGWRGRKGVRAKAAVRHGVRMLACIGLLVAPLSACSGPATRPLPAPHSIGYFDPHSHMGGVLPWSAYVDLPAYIAGLEGRGRGVTRADKLRFYTWLDDDWYAAHSAALGDRPFASNQRFGLGARATLALVPPHARMRPRQLDAALERIFTATPFTEFDSAYAFHSPAYTWLAGIYYSDNAETLGEAMCTAGVLELARTHITRSEQSISFIGGWQFDAHGFSAKLQSVLCSARKPRELAATFARLHETPPRVRIILMTHTDQLGENAAGDQYQTFEGTGRCHAVPLPTALKLAPERMYDALLGRNQHGADIVPSGGRTDFFDTLVGIDTAGPEMTCFSPAGMAYYTQLVDAVYRAARVRRAAGWRGKLLVHTHVGEGFTQYYARQPPAQPWTFASVFARLPVLAGNVVSNATAPRANVGMLLDAIAAVRHTHPDLDDYVVVRFGHVTHATLAQAEAMARLHIEADINLDSNLATGAWSFADMPDRSAAARYAACVAAQPLMNFEVSDLPQLLLPDPGDADAVAGVFGSHPLKYMLMAHVRVMLGTDGEGVEHSSMPREHALAASLIRWWTAHDPAFRAQAGDVGPQTFFNNANQHLGDMASDAARLDQLQTRRRVERFLQERACSRSMMRDAAVRSPAGGLLQRSQVGRLQSSSDARAMNRFLQERACSRSSMRDASVWSPAGGLLQRSQVGRLQSTSDARAMNRFLQERACSRSMMRDASVRSPAGGLLQRSQVGRLQSSSDARAMNRFLQERACSRSSMRDASVRSPAGGLLSR